MAVEIPLAVSHVVTPHQIVRGPDISNRLFVGVGTLLLAIVLIAFSTRFFSRPATAPPMPLFVHVHAWLFTAWVLLFIAQAVLAQRGLIQYHRKMGLSGVALALLIMVVGFYTAIEGARRGHNPSGAPNAFAFMVIPWTDIVLFTTFFFAAWRFRKQTELHKRFMLFATVGGFLAPAIARLPLLPAGPRGTLYMFAIFIAVVLIPAVANWLWLRRSHWLDWTGAVVIIASVPLRILVGLTDTWQRFAAWTIS